MLTKIAPSAALDSAPGWAGPSALGVPRRPGVLLQLPMERQRKAAFRVSAYPNAGRRTVHYPIHPILRSCKNGGPGGAGALNESASLALEVHPRLTPGAFLVSFCASKKKLAVRRNLTVSFGAVKRNGVGKSGFRGCQPLTSWLLFARAEVTRGQPWQGLGMEYGGFCKGPVRNL